MGRRGVGLQADENDTLVHGSIMNKICEICDIVQAATMYSFS